MSNNPHDADIIVIGSGVLGGLAAHALAKAGKSVIILEAGPRIERWKIVEAWRNATNKGSKASPYPNPPHAPTPFGGGYLVQKGPVAYGTTYLRVVGGTTWHWGSATWRMIPNDFKLNTLYGKGRDWPIDYATIEPFYARAEAELGVNGRDNEDQSGQNGQPFPPRSTPYPMAGLDFNYMQRRLGERLHGAGFYPVHEPNGRASRPYDGRPQCSGNASCNPVCPIGAKYTGDVHIEKAEREGAKVIANAVVYRIEVGPDAKIAAVHYRTPEKTEHRISGKYFVLAANAIEAPKLMLMSTSPAFPRGVGNSSDMVGRNLMDHTGMGMSMTVKEALFPGDGPTELLVFLNGRDGPFRKRHAAYKHKVRNDAPNREVAAELIAQGVLGSRLDQQIRFKVARQLTFAVDLETLPYPKNRIVPSSEKFDAIGIPVPEFYYDVDDYWNAGRDAAVKDWHRFAELLDGQITKMDLGHQNREHIMGTMIMGADPKDSVVDADCRCHDHANLFIASTGVMPSGGCVNPTLTGAALAIRLADLIEKEV